MKILVGQHELKIDKKDKVNQNEYKVTKCEFEFDEAITNDLVKIALFTNSAGTYKQYIINNECDIPAEILEKQETTTLGVYAYKEENEELKLRYSPEEIKFYVSNGSYKEDAENTEPITPTDKEQMEQALQNGLNDINNKIDEVDEKLDGIETAIEETNNLNLDVSDKVDGDVTVTLTKKDASTKTVVLSDGTSLEFNWDGTKLGIKTSDEEEYTYVDLQGPQGVQGPQGNQGEKGDKGDKGDTGPKGDKGDSGASEWGQIEGTLSNQTDLNNALSGKQSTLVSGTNIKTINNESILGSGNINIQGGSGSSTWGSITGTLSDQADLQTVLNSKANASSIPTKVSQLTNDSGYLTSETDPVFNASVAKNITSTDITNWNNKSNFSGSYNDLTNKPTIPVVPTNISSFTNDSNYQNATQVQTAINNAIGTALNGSY